jgi:hypothetical protein
VQGQHLCYNCNIHIGLRLILFLAPEGTSNRIPEIRLDNSTATGDTILARVRTMSSQNDYKTIPKQLVQAFQK